MTKAYITGVGAYLPGEPVDNEQLAELLGDGTTRGAALRRRALAANGISARHYAVDKAGMTVMLNEELAANAVRRALSDRGLGPSDVEMLATGTTQGDLLIPGFASMVHGRLGGGPMEILSASGVCASGMAALKAAVSAVRLGDHQVAVAVGSELVSRSFVNASGPDTADTSFLRWTLSDGAGAVVVEPEPRADGLSLRVDWMRLVSHAHAYPVCMSAGLADDALDKGGAPAGPWPAAGTTWLDRRDETARTRHRENAGRENACQCEETCQHDGSGPRALAAPRLRQDMNALPALIDMGVAEYTGLVEAGRIDPAIEHVLCHYSAEHFREKLFARLREAGHQPDGERWFTNLHTAGNTGAASIFVMLEAAMPRLAPGDRVLLVVPESGRFTLAFAHLTCLGGRTSGQVSGGGTSGPSQAELSASPLGPPLPADPPGVARAITELAQVWADLDTGLARVPVVRRIEDGSATLGDYRRLLLNLRQQVVDGGRWISLAASNFSAELFWLRSAAIRHAAAEHRDYQLLEQDYAAAGGDPAAMAATAPNVGSAALSAFIFHRAGLPDPVDLLGAMFVIEGLGVRKAAGWADRLRDSAGLRDDQLTFLRYHAEGDEEHFGVLAAALRSGVLDDGAITRIVKTAKVVARLYTLQLEELDNV